MFESIEKLALGLVTGIAFGFLLQKGRVAKYETIVKQFQFLDWTVVKTMGMAVVVGAVGVTALVHFGMASLHIKPLMLTGVIGGAVLFGIGMGVLGYCPGTCVAGCGEGRRDAMVGCLGMLFGAGIFVALYPQLKPFIESLGNEGELTFPNVTSTSPWLWVAGLIVAGSIALAFSLRLRQTPQPVNTQVRHVMDLGSHPKL
jgi:uncharacterized protein